ncbi:MAG: hypothetical protein V1905_03935 [bacterium]
MNLQSSGIGDLLSDIGASFSSKRVTLVTFLVLLTGAKFLLKPDLPILIIYVIALWLLLSFVFWFLIKRQRKINVVNTIHFVWFTLELVFMTLIIHWLGGVEWVGVIFYTLFCVYGIFLLPKNAGYALSFLSVVFYVSLVIAEYMRLIDHHDFLNHDGLYLDGKYVLITLIFTVGLFHFLTFATGMFAKRLRERSQRLVEASALLEDAKNVLEVRVKARTEELEIVNQGLDEHVRLRTKELEENKTELQKKVDELEAIQKLMVGRELKMMELKKELDQFKKIVANK